MRHIISSMLFCAALSSPAMAQKDRAYGGNLYFDYLESTYMACVIETPMEGAACECLLYATNQMGATDQDMKAFFTGDYEEMDDRNKMSQIAQTSWSCAANPRQFEAEMKRWREAATPTR